MIKKISLRQHQLNMYPMNVPVIKHMTSLDFTTPVTIFVGDNGSGKSTLLKAIAHHQNAIKTASLKSISTLEDVIQPLSDHLIIEKTRVQRGLYFSGEDFITYIQQLTHEKALLLKQIEETKEAYKHKSTFAYNQALSAPKKELHALLNTYDGELTDKSHGEGFLAFFKSRMREDGIYFLDEPETPLSAINQYQLLVILSDLASMGAQIIMATHSPILMAIEGATIYEFTDTIEHVTYDHIDSIRFQKDFINNKEKYLARIRQEDTKR